MALLKKEERELLMLEYKELLTEIWQRRQNTWLIHSILLASTLIISFRSNPELLPYPYIVSLVLVIISFVFQFSMGPINDLYRKRRREIENMLGMKGPKGLIDKVTKTKSYWIRYRLWPALWVSLATIYLLLILDYLLLR